MPRRSRKWLFLYCVDHRRNKYVVQSQPEQLRCRTRCWHFNHFSGTLPIRWKALENTECFFTCACRVPTPAQLSPRWDLYTLPRYKQQWQFCTGQVIHFSGKMQVTGGCSESCLRACKLAVQYCNSVTRCSDVFKPVPCRTQEEQQKKTYEFVLKRSVNSLANL